MSPPTMPARQASRAGEPPENTKNDALFSGAFVRLLVLQSTFGVSFSSFLILPKFLRVELGASASQIGWMAGIALGTSAVFAPGVGLLVRRFSSKRVLMLALVMEAAAAFGFLGVERVGLYSLLLRVMQGLAYVVVFTAIATLVAQAAPPRQLARALGYMGVSLLITNALAPLVAEPLANRYGWSAVFILAGSVASLAIILAAKVQPVPASTQLHGQNSDDPGGVRPALPAHYGSLMMGAGLGVMFTYVQPYALQQGAKDVGQLFLGYALAAGAVRILFGGLSDRIGNARMAAMSMALYAVVVALAAGLTPQTVWIFGIGLGVSHGFLYPALSASGLMAVSQAARPVFLGWFSCGFNTGFAITVLTLGPLADHFGFPPVFVLGGVALATGVIPLFRFQTTQNAWLRP